MNPFFGQILLKFKQTIDASLSHNHSNNLFYPLKKDILLEANNLFYPFDVPNH